MTTVVSTVLLGTYADAVFETRFTGTRLDAVRQVITAPAPSFVAAHPATGVRYAVAEVEHGAVSAFAPTGELLATLPSGGSYPCHALVAGAHLWVANYGDGTAAVVPLGPDGRFAGSPRRLPGAGSGPDADRQEGPHAHSTTAVDTELWVADLGADLLRRFRDEAGEREAEPVRMPAGSGPRHLAVLADGTVAVSTELDDGLVLVRDGTVVVRVPATGTPPPPGGRNQPSHVAVVGELLVVAVRGADVLSVFRVGADGPVHLADSPVGGAWPRHFAAVGDHVLVACEHSDEVTALALDQATGRAKLIGSTPVPAPSCVLPL